ncbi:amino acid transporter [Aspergillus oryzae 100-8]|uniref:Amino acid transporter n=1 Tax=Aspergillus oryzae (strain 3.042) TaxID=1160506 RepID=I7ZRL7_ASPO3|nr:amino acid transporter [Aspergillus oryzae 3.042]KDE77905.1 amino acid transporter [Aspergillus oryzae 100-8]|eukprot:EIT74507.1 amino acid transporter [Aspergillus oryzae 3.042]
MTDTADIKNQLPYEVEKLSDESLAPDDAVLQAQGHRPELARSFSWVGAIGLSFSIANSWLGYGATFGTPLAYGGGPTVLFGVMIAAVAQWIVLLGLAELCSGQYHFTYILAPPKYKKFAAYTVGITNVIAWWVSAASGIIYTGISAFGIAVFWYPDFQHERWQIYLCYVLVVTLTCKAPRRYDYLTKTTFTLSITGLIIVLIAVLASGRGRYHPEILTTFQGTSGWDTAPAWLLSITMGQYCYAAIGAVTHIAEEMPQPGRRIPLVMYDRPQINVDILLTVGSNLGVLVGVMTAVPWVTVMLCGIHDIDAVHKAFIPSMEVYYQATGSKVGATALQAFMTFLYWSKSVSFACGPSQWITSSRIAWAFSRDVCFQAQPRIKNGLPFSHYWNFIDPKFNIPVRTTFLSVSFCLLYGLVYIASSTAFNCIVNMSILFLNISFTVPQAILATVGRDKLPVRAFNLGRWGYAVNIFSTVWLTFSGILFCFPTKLPATAGSMNYGSAVLVGVYILIMLLWLERKNKFTGPKINWDALNMSNKLA